MIRCGAAAGYRSTDRPRTSRAHGASAPTQAGSQWRARRRAFVVPCREVIGGGGDPARRKARFEEASAHLKGASPRGGLGVGLACVGTSKSTLSGDEPQPRTASAINAARGENRGCLATDLASGEAAHLSDGPDTCACRRARSRAARQSTTVGPRRNWF